MSDVDISSPYLDFEMVYDGPALANHEIDIRELAPALLNAAELFRNVNRLTNPSDPDVEVHIRGTRESSFLIELKLVFDGTMAVLRSQDMQSTDNLLELITFVGGGYSCKKRCGLVSPFDRSKRRMGSVWNGQTAQHSRHRPRCCGTTTHQNHSAAHGMSRPLAADGIDELRISRNRNPEIRNRKRRSTSLGAGRPGASRGN